MRFIHTKEKFLAALYSYDGVLEVSSQYNTLSDNEHLNLSALISLANLMFETQQHANDILIHAAVLMHSVRYSTDLINGKKVIDGIYNELKSRQLVGNLDSIDMLYWAMKNEFRKRQPLQAKTHNNPLDVVPTTTPSNQQTRSGRTTPLCATISRSAPPLRNHIYNGSANNDPGNRDSATPLGVCRLDGVSPLDEGGVQRSCSPLFFDNRAMGNDQSKAAHNAFVDGLTLPAAAGAKPATAGTEQTVDDWLPRCVTPTLRKGGRWADESSDDNSENEKPSCGI